MDEIDKEIIKRLTGTELQAFAKGEAVVFIDRWHFHTKKEISDELTKRGFKTIEAGVGFDFRVKYELEARGKNNIVITLSGSRDILDDIRVRAKVVKISLHSLFCNFCGSKISSQFYKDLYKLYAKYSKNPQFNKLSEDEGDEFLQEIHEDNIKYTQARFLSEFEEKKKLLEAIRVPRSSYEFWFSAVKIIGSVSTTLYKVGDEYFDECEKEYFEWLEDLNSSFQTFIKNGYEALFSLSGYPSLCTIDKVQDFIAADHKNKLGNKKLAFIVLDGMNYWQWLLLKEAFEKAGLAVEEKVLFSWLPTITAWARQAIFAGRKPNLSEGNENEGELFKIYWQGARRLDSSQVFYKNLKTSDDQGEDQEDAQFEVPDSVEVAGFVINSLDNIMHGESLGSQGLYQETKLWISVSKICEKIKRLQESNFDIYISSDHGNVEAKAALKVEASQKTLARTRSKRFMEFDTEAEALSFIDSHKDFALANRASSVYWTDRGAFGSGEGKMITHGGSSLLELLIPLGVIKKTNGN